MTESNMVKSATKAHTLDEATQALINSIKRKDARFRVWFMITWTLLLVIGIFGIYKQNQIANANKQHIDCIVKLFTTPTPHGSAHKVIVNPNTACKIQGQN